MSEPGSPKDDKALAVPDASASPPAPTPETPAAPIAASPAAISTSASEPLPSEVAALRSKARARPSRALATVTPNLPSLPDDRAFHATVGRAAAGAAIGGFAMDLLFRATGGAPSIAAIVVALSAGALAAIGHAEPERKWLKTIAFGMAGVAAGVTHALTAGAWPFFAALALGAIVGPFLSKGESTGRIAATSLLTGVFAFLGIYVAGVLEARGILNGLVPGPLATAIISGTGGPFLGLGALPKHLSSDDPVKHSYRLVLAKAQGELGDVLGRALRIYEAIRADVASRPIGPTERQLEAQVSDLSMKILAIGEQCRTIEHDLGSAPLHELDERIAELDNKLAGTKDDAAKRTLQRAKKSLEDQRGAIASIKTGLERVYARLHANVAMLEKVRFSLVHARSSLAERFGGESSPLADTLEELSRELEVTSAAMGEVFGEQAVQGLAGEIDDAAKAADAAQPQIGTGTGSGTGSG